MKDNSSYVLGGLLLGIIALLLMIMFTPADLTEPVTVIHEGCEYITYRGSITHAGNCSNHIEQPCKQIRYR